MGKHKSSASTDIALSSIQIFMNDGTIDIHELEHMLNLALRDGVMDEDEKHVLGNVFSKIHEHEVKPEVWTRIREVKQKYAIK
jgi:hypothetical protein